MIIDTKKSTVLKTFAKFDFHEVKSGGNHIKLKNSVGISVSIPDHKRVKGSTLQNALKIAGIDKTNFFKEIK